jgi:hypothetical protein
VVDVLSIFFLGCVQLVAVLGGDLHYNPVGVVNIINLCAGYVHQKAMCTQYVFHYHVPNPNSRKQCKKSVKLFSNSQKKVLLFYIILH